MDRVNGEPKPPVDLERIGRRWGWKLEGSEHLPRVTAAVAEGKPVGVYQDAGRTDWWDAATGWPGHFERLSSWPAEACWEALLVISDRLLVPPPGLEPATLFYRPPTLTLGVTLTESFGAEELEPAVSALFAQHHLSLACLTAVASAQRSKHDAHLVEFAEQRQVPLLTYAPDKLALVRPPPLPPATECEAAAMLAAAARALVVSETICGPLCLAIARRVAA